MTLNTSDDESNRFTVTKALRVSRRHILKTGVAGAIALTLPHTEAAIPGLGSAAATAAQPTLPIDAITPIATANALPFDLADVRLLTSTFQDAQSRDGAYLLFLEPDRLLHNFLLNAGLTPKGDSYGGWEAEGIAGHCAGHYLSACSLMYRATGDARFKQRSDYMVAELSVCQNAVPDGLVTAIPDARAIFAKIAADGTVSGWVPWYTMHKLFAGLRDSYTYCGNAQAKQVFLTLTDWAVAVTQNLTDNQFQSMLQTEHGGMVETVADAYAMTGDPRYLALARRFTHHVVFDPLAAGEDKLDGLHSNTQIPKMIGYERLYELTGDQPYHAAPLFFLKTVTENRTYANGGNGDREHFFPISDFRSHIGSDYAVETCCTYNMLKLTKALFQQDPRGSYADYYETALLNHILASQESTQGLMIYHTPMKSGHFKVYGDPVNAFWCCTGTGMENHARYGEAIYFRSPDNDELYVNLYIASTLNWRERGVTVRQDTKYPESDRTRLTINSAKPETYSVKLRCPGWANGMTVSVNGHPYPAAVTPGEYTTISRIWRSGDVVDIQIPMTIRSKQLPHIPGKQAIFFGPTLLAGALGTKGMDKLPDIAGQQAPYDNLPALRVADFVTSNSDIASQILPAAGAAPLTFQTSGLAQPADITLIPLYRLNHQRMNIYWSVYTPEEYEAQRSAEEAEERAQQQLDARTVDRFFPGNQQSEVDHDIQSQNSRTGVSGGRNWRDAFGGGRFSFVFKLETDTSYDLECTYWGDDSGGRVFDILIDDTAIATQTLDRNNPGNPYVVDYAIPSTLTVGKTSITVVFQAKPGALAGGLFDCRLLRSSP